MIAQVRSAANSIPSRVANCGASCSSVPDTEDARWIAQTLHVNRQMYGRLIGKYRERLLISMTYVLQDHTEAEDVTQEAFLQAYLKLSTFRQEGTFYAWLYSIAWNIARRQRRQQPSHVSLDHLSEISGTEPTARQGDTNNGRVCSLCRLRKAIGHIGDRFRKVLLLRHLEGYSYQGIADELGLPVGTVRSRIHRGRRQLLSRLDKYVE
jgi:RNA polymerase sigma-70 factor (ECF subfamily)